jgi:hypothetical protein
MSLRASTLSRYFPFAFAVILTAVFITPYCGFLLHCGCRQLWQGGAQICNVHLSSGPHCPFCARGSASFYLLTCTSIVVAQFIALALAARRRGVLVSSAISIAVFLAMGASLAWIEASHDHYSRSLLAPIVNRSCAAFDDTAHASHPGKRYFDHSLLSRLLARYVNDDGWVDYDGLKNERHLLNRYLESLGNADPGELINRCEQLAFWINGYNSLTLADVLDDVYGKARSVREVAGFFNRKGHFIASHQLTLDEIEERGREINDPRIHFALVCASTSCPKLQKFAYDGRDLDLELEQAARKFLGDPARGARIELPDRLLLSPILKWYSGDFSGRSGGLGHFFARVEATISDRTALDYVAKYAAPDVKRWIDEKRPVVTYFDYDWSLNAQSTHKSPSGASQ